MIREMLYALLLLFSAGVMFLGLWAIWHGVAVWRESRKRR